MEKIKLDELQLKVMKALWQLEEASVTQVLDLLSAEREFALTTISTILQRLHKRNMVDFRKEGRQYIYRPLISEKETQTSMTNNLIDKLFSGQSSVLVNHLLESSEFDPEELEQLKQLIEEAQKKKK